MDELNEIFAKDLGIDLDADLAAASETLEKIAAAEGIDLGVLSDEQVAELVADLMPKVAGEGPPPGLAAKKDDEKDEKKDEGEKKSSDENVVTHADVAAALAKYAGDNGIDLTQVSREAWAEAYNKMAALMTSPEYEAEKKAEAEMAEKLAEADLIGRAMARSFADEQEKIAKTRSQAEMGLHGPEQPKGGLRAPAKPAKAEPSGFDKFHEIAEAGRKRKAEAEAAASKTQAARGKIMDAARGAVNSVRAGAGKAALTVGRAAGVQGRGAAKLVGGGLLAGGAAAAGGAAYGAKKLMDKKSLDEAALELARTYVRDELGIDPDTGEKLASEEPTEEAVEARAAEMLKEHGYL